MTVAFRSTASVINATAGTSVTVSKPAGITDGDALFAFIAELGVGTITPPAGWTLVGTQDANTDLRFAVYWKIAASEGASWTWTLGASVRNWGSVHAYTGVDPVTPVYGSGGEPHTGGGTAFTTDLQAMAFGGPYLAAAAAYRTASGSGTTWTELSGTELVDHTTNAGAGQDITGVVLQSAGIGPGLGQKTFTASQSQTKAASWIVAIKPLFTLPAAPYTMKTELALGADPDGDPAGWSWTDVSGHVREESGYSFRFGRTNEGALADPTQVSLTFDNIDTAGGGANKYRFTPDNPTGAYYPNIRRNTPLRVSIENVGTRTPEILAQTFVDEWPPSWSTGRHDAWVSIISSGRFRRFASTSDPLRSVLQRSQAKDGPVAQWPLEDELNATSFASALSGGSPMLITGAAPIPASDTTTAGSAPLPTLASGTVLTGAVAPYTINGGWNVEAIFVMPADLAGAVTLLEWTSAGTVRRWVVTLTPNTPSASQSTLKIQGFNSAGTEVLADTGVAVDDVEIYGLPVLVFATAATNGADIDWEVFIANHEIGHGSTGTLAASLVGAITQVKVTANANLAGSAVGHIAVYDNGGTVSAFHSSDIDGHVGENAAQRINRVCGEEGVPFVLSTGVGSTSMGSQPIATLLDIIRECEAADGGILTDCSPASDTFGNDPGGLYYIPAVALYNRPVDITIDLAGEQLYPPFAPTYDDQLIANDFTASRSGGSSARFVDQTGPVGVDAEGRYRSGGTFNLEADDQLLNRARWAVNVGTAPGMRYPRVVLNFRGSPTTLQPWIESSQVGARLRMTHPPAGHSPAPIDLIVVGYTMQIRQFEWSVEAVCVPAAPYDVFEIESGPENTSRIAADSVLAAGYTSSDTSLSVTSTSAAARWIDSATYPSKFPITIVIAGERMTCTAITGTTATQTFTVTRGLDGMTKALPSGSEVQVVNPARIAL